jgi:hypothetical protein
MDSARRYLANSADNSEGWAHPALVPEMDNRYLRVILLPDGETIHNAFFDRDFVP